MMPIAACGKISSAAWETSMFGKGSLSQYNHACAGVQCNTAPVLHQIPIYLLSNMVVMYSSNFPTIYIDTVPGTADFDK